MPNIPSLASKPSIEFFLEKYTKEAEKLPESGAEAKALDGLMLYDENAMARVDRRVRTEYHPDAYKNKERTAAEKSVATMLRDKYNRGRTAYFEQGKTLEAHRRLGDKQNRQVSTQFLYTKPDYQPDQGDIFYHPHRDMWSKQQQREVPRDFRHVAIGSHTIPENAPAFVHAYFRDFMVSHPTVRSKFMEICLAPHWAEKNETDTERREELQKRHLQERDELDGYRQFIQAVLHEKLDISTVQELIEECRAVEKQIYIKDIGGFGIMDPATQEKVKARINDFYAFASIGEIHILKDYIFEACKQNFDLPLEHIMQKAKDAFRENQVKNKQLFLAEGMPDTEERGKEEPEYAPDSSAADSFFLGLGANFDIQRHLSIEEEDLLDDTEEGDKEEL